MGFERQIESPKKLAFGMKDNSGDKEAISSIHRQSTTGLVFMAIFLLSLFVVAFMPLHGVPYGDSDEVQGTHTRYEVHAYALTFVIAGVAFVLRRLLYTGSLQRLIHGAKASYLLAAILCVNGLMLSVTVGDTSLYVPFAISGAAIVYFMRPSHEKWEKSREEAARTAESSRWITKGGHGAWVVGGVLLMLGIVLLSTGGAPDVPYWSDAVPFMLVALGGLLFSFRRMTVFDGDRERIAIRTSLFGMYRDRIYGTDEFDSVYTRTRAGRRGNVHYNIHLQGPGVRIKILTTMFKDEAQKTQERISEIAGLSVIKPPEESAALPIAALVGLIFILPLLTLIYLLLR